MDRDVNAAILYGLNKLNFEHIRPNQCKVIEKYIQGQDVLFCSPTGSGKSLTFEIAPFVYQHICKTAENTTPKCIAIVVSPLVSLMKTQVRTLNEKGIRAVYVRDDAFPDSDSNDILAETLDAIRIQESDSDLSDGAYDILFGSPESLLGRHRKLILDLSRQKLLKLLFIDEAHCIKKFGKPDMVKKKAAYRPSYGKLGELRSLAGPHVPIVALTATASLDTRNMILNDLCMKNSYQLVIDPDKRNIKYCVVHAKSYDICHNFEWLINLLRTHGPSMPRMIIFFRQIKHISEVYAHLETSLGTDAYVNFNPAGPNDDRNRLFDMFHMKTDDDVKDSICSSYQDPKGTTRVVLSSTSFSMGLDVKGVDTVLHYGPANDMDDYFQETGRAGRCAEQNSHAVLIKYKRSTSSTNITKDMKLYVNTSTVCRRTLLLTQFVDKPSPASPRHTCCDVCSSVCKCLCNCEEDCVCDNVCPGHDSMVVREMNTTYAEDSNTSSDASDCDYSSDTDVDEYLSRQPQILQYSSEED